MSERRTKGRPPHEDILTPAEWKVAECVRHGLSNPQIAKRQGVSLDAVKFHVSNILAKLACSSRSELQKWDGVRVESQLSNRLVEANAAQIHSIGQIARFVSDIEASTAWFRDVIGLRHLFTFGDMSFFDCGGTRLLLNLGNPETNSLIYFKVPDIHQTQAYLIQNNVEIVSAPHMIHQHEDGTEEWMAFFNDPDGQPLGIMSSTLQDNDTELLGDEHE